jgi:predicted amidophosphoribosyltransferase
MEKAFSIAAKEMQKAFKTAGENIRKSTVKKTIICSACGEKSETNATFCHSCGKKLQE